MLTSSRWGCHKLTLEAWKLTLEAPKLMLEAVKLTLGLSKLTLEALKLTLDEPKLAGSSLLNWFGVCARRKSYIISHTAGIL